MSDDLIPPVSNIPEFSVSEIASAIRRTLEDSFSRVRVRGEITEFKTYPSGHSYLSLKDENGKLRAVIWKGAKRTIGVIPENGMEVVATGKITAYGDRSEYQLTIERLEYAGVGAMLARIETLRKRLAEEGLFDSGRKKPLPTLPTLVGVISSPKGAVLHDIMTTIARRFPRSILLWPVPVQGEGAAEKIAAAIRAMDRLPQGDIPRPDVLIVARGGGSLEDLMAFNDEIVVRAVAACSLPVISAVGHETDTTLIDFVSDRRAPTPTAAAEMAVPARAELLADLAQRSARLQNGLSRKLEQSLGKLQSVASMLPDLPATLLQARMRLDDRAERLAPSLPRYVAQRAAQIAAIKLPDPHHWLARETARLGPLNLTPPIDKILASAGQRLEILGTRLEGSNYEKLLARGFAMVRDAAGKPVTKAAGLTPDEKLDLHFADGHVPVQVAPK